eukprot:scpid55853/ scgid4780/ 
MALVGMEDADSNAVPMTVASIDSTARQDNGKRRYPEVQHGLDQDLPQRKKRNVPLPLPLPLDKGSSEYIATLLPPMSKLVSSSCLAAENGAADEVTPPAPSQTGPSLRTESLIMGLAIPQFKHSLSWTRNPTRVRSRSNFGFNTGSVNDRSKTRHTDHPVTPIVAISPAFSDSQRSAVDARITHPASPVIPGASSTNEGQSGTSPNSAMRTSTQDRPSDRNAFNALTNLLQDYRQSSSEPSSDDNDDGNDPTPGPGREDGNIDTDSSQDDSDDDLDDLPPELPESNSAQHVPASDHQPPSAEDQSAIQSVSPNIQSVSGQQLTSAHQQPSSSVVFVTHREPVHNTGGNTQPAPQAQVLAYSTANAVAGNVGLPSAVSSHPGYVQPAISHSPAGSLPMVAGSQANVMQTPVNASSAAPPTTVPQFMHPGAARCVQYPIPAFPPLQQHPAMPAPQQHPAVPAPQPQQQQLQPQQLNGGLPIFSVLPQHLQASPQLSQTFAPGQTGNPALDKMIYNQAMALLAMNQQFYTRAHQYAGFLPPSTSN